jgi:hypothetical protein
MLQLSMTVVQMFRVLINNRLSKVKQGDSKFNICLSCKDYSLEKPALSLFLLLLSRAGFQFCE